MQQKKGKTRIEKPGSAKRPEYVAAVRYLDGRRDLFHIRFADDLEDARKLVIDEVGDVRSLVIAPRR
jgi:hypothetical protein